MDREIDREELVTWFERIFPRAAGDFFIFACNHRKAIGLVLITKRCGHLSRSTRAYFLNRHGKYVRVLKGNKFKTT